MGKMILSSEQLRIVSVELDDAQQQLSNIEMLLADAGVPGDNLADRVQRTIDDYKVARHLRGYLSECDLITAVKKMARENYDKRNCGCSDGR